MRYLKAEILFFLVFVTDFFRAELDPDGKNVCLTSENYEEIVMVQVQKRKTEKKWCLTRWHCSKTKLYYEDEPRVFKRTRIVAKCCDGYREEIGRTDCVPACLRGCKNGKCVAPDICACDPGFHGPECDKECSEGWWGVNCVNECTCSDNEKCNREKGCECKPGWMGDGCDLPCQEGYYGYSCEKKCKCDLACNPETGECTTNTLTRVPLPATTYDIETSTNGHQSIEKGQVSVSEGTERNQVSVSEETERNQNSESEGIERNQVSEITEKSEGKIFTEVVDTTESNWGEDIEIEDEIHSETAASKETELPNSVTSMTEIAQNSKHDAISADTTPKAMTEPSATYVTASNKSREKATEKEEDVKLRMQNEINFLKGLETFVRNASVKDTEANDYTSEIPREDTLDITAPNNKTFQITLTNVQQPDGDEADNFINTEKGSASRDYLNTKFHFFGSLSILTGISLVIFVIAAKWIIVSHKRRVQKITITQKEKALQAEQGKDQTQNFFSVSCCAENPVYLSDVDINKSVPILQTFKPMNSYGN